MNSFRFKLSRDSKDDYIVSMEPDEANFKDFMIMAQFMCYIVAKNSDTGFEKALEIINKGAMDWRDKHEQSED